MSAAVADRKTHAALATVRRLIGIYFWLLLLEGALRKWVLPDLATPLLLVRDPILLAVYFYAIEGKLWRENGFQAFLMVLGFFSLLGSLLAIMFYSNSTLFVTAFGVRTNFLHMPLIFLMGAVCDAADVRRWGKWLLVLALPCALLMVVQFYSPAGAFVNATAGGEGAQLIAIFDKIRPPSIFSFTTGVAEYYALVTAFLLYGLQSNAYPRWLLALAGFALPMALAVSGSRLALGYALVVVAFAGAAILLQPRLLGPSVKIALAAGCILLMLSFAGFFNEGIDVIATRVEVASDFERARGGVVGRTLAMFTTPFNELEAVPLLGVGLGMGTNAGAKLLTGQLVFLLNEQEWSRVILESGPLLGLAYIGWRVSTTVWLGVLARRRLHACDALPWLLLGACLFNLLTGQFGRTTTLGFTAIAAGMCLAACNGDRGAAKPQAGTP